MRKVKHIKRRGVTLLEITVASMIVVIPIMSVGTILAESQRGWHKMYAKVNSDVVSDGYVADRLFNVIVRGADRKKLLVDPSGAWVEVYYWQNTSAAIADSYARFYTSNGELKVESGSRDPRRSLSTRLVCKNVTGCHFSSNGRSVQMVLRLDHGKQSSTVVTSAVMHN